MSMQTIHHNFTSIRMNESFASYQKDNYNFKYAKQFFDLDSCPLIYNDITEEYYSGKIGFVGKKTGLIIYFFFFFLLFISGLPMDSNFILPLSFMCLFNIFGEAITMSPKSWKATEDIKLT